MKIYTSIDNYEKGEYVVNGFNGLPRVLGVAGEKIRVGDAIYFAEDTGLLMLYANKKTNSKKEKRY